MTKFSRKQFLKKSGLALAATSFLPVTGLTSKSVMDSDTINIGVFGSRSMGYSLLEHALNIEGVVCGGICDVDQNILDEKADSIDDITGTKPSTYTDYRRLLEDKSIDAVFIGTPDHWHCLQTVDALQADKHVYVEKPLANSIAESEIIERAANRYGKVVQVGQQQRSGKHWMDVVDVIQAGTLGKIRHINIWANFRYGQGPEINIDEPVPDRVDYDMWLGPAQQRPFNKNHFHGSWRFQWAYGGGLMTDYGTHLLDIPLWALNIDGPPRSVSSIGGIFSGRDRGIEMADTQKVIYQFDDFNMTWEHNGGIQSGPYGRHYGVAFVGNNGTLIVNRDGWELIPETTDGVTSIEPIPFQKGIEWNHDTHVKNFIDAIRFGSDLYCPVEAGNLSSFYAHIGNIAYRTNNTMKWDKSGNLLDKEKYSHLITPEYREPWKLPKI